MPGQLNFWPGEAGPAIRWSVTRGKRFRDCLRRYYYHHYASAKNKNHEAFVLKHLSNRYSWTGNAVHEALEYALKALRDGRVLGVDDVVNQATKRMRTQYLESVKKRYREKPGVAFGLFEHEFAENIAKETWAGCQIQAERCIRQAMDLPLWGLLRDLKPENWFAVETMRSFRLRAGSVIVKPDLAYRDPDGCVVLVDWKTGKPRPEDDRMQLGVYGLYAQQAGWGEPLVGVLAYLDNVLLDEQPVDVHVLETTKITIEQSMTHMRAVLRNGHAHEEDFPRTDDLRMCGMCSFKRICGRE